MPILKYDTLPFDGQAHFINMVGSAKWRHGSYENTFKALHELTSDFELLDLDRIKTILDKQRGSNKWFRRFGPSGHPKPANDGHLKTGQRE
jgi:hypothetical protein